MVVGHFFTCLLYTSQTKVTEQFTQPPKHFTEDSLLSAMERAGAEDMGDEVERKGLGLSLIHI